MKTSFLSYFDFNKPQFWVLVQLLIGTLLLWAFGLSTLYLITVVIALGWGLCGFSYEQGRKDEDVEKPRPWIFRL